MLLLLAGVQLLGSQLEFEEPELEGVGVLCWPPGQLGPVAAGGPAQSLLGQLPSSVDHASSGPQLLECVGWGQWMGHQMWSSDVEVGASQIKGQREQSYRSGKLRGLYKKG